jgi:hypothetical protein
VAQKKRRWIVISVDTLSRIAAGHKIGAIAELLPWAWKARQVAG